MSGYGFHLNGKTGSPETESVGLQFVTREYTIAEPEKAETVWELIDRIRGE